MSVRKPPLLPLPLDRAASLPLQRQLYGELRAAILAGRLAPGTRLPASRALAVELGVSRNTVLGAFDQLLGEGYVEGRHGAGTFVAAMPPDRLLAAARPTTATGRPLRSPRLSRRSRELTTTVRERPAGFGAFLPGLPDCSDFPFALWARLLAKSWRRPAPSLYAGGDRAGHAPLRAAIADYLRAMRGVACDAGRVIVVSGIRQAVDLTARLVIDPGDAAWVEEPGYFGVRAALAAMGARLVPVPVDEEGCRVEDAVRLAPDARLACLAPSQQYPLGGALSLSRRLALLDWARAADAWILEDDYDSEYRYAGRPLAALQGLDRDGRVVYVGSLSKVMFPSLRLAYLVAPEGLVDRFLAMRATIDDHPSAVVQPALAAFIADGHLAAHVRRMRRRYAARQAALLRAAARHLDGLLVLRPAEAGMHLVAELAPSLARRMDDQEAARRAAAAGIVVVPLSASYLQAPRRQGLLLGYAAVAEPAIGPAVRRLAAALAVG